MKLEFSRQIFEESLNIIKIRPVVGVELFHTNGQTDMTKLTFAFGNFAIARKKGSFIKVKI
jgi:hypothetical protein